VGVEVTSVSWLGQLAVEFKQGRPTGQKQELFDGRTVENKGKSILTMIWLIENCANEHKQWRYSPILNL